MSRVILGLAMVVALLAFGTTAWILTERLTEPKTVSGEGVVVAPAGIGGPFKLTSDAGKPVTEEVFAGKYALVYFGYSFCPDVCPTGLQTIAAGIDKLGEDSKKVVPVFVSVDPDRDTPDQLAQYVDLFHPSMVGLTGTAEEIKAVAKKFRVYYALHKDKDPENYPVDHSSFTYLMGPDWKIVAVFRHDATPGNIADALKKVL